MSMTKPSPHFRGWLHTLLLSLFLVFVSHLDGGPSLWAFMQSVRREIRRRKDRLPFYWWKLRWGLWYRMHHSPFYWKHRLSSWLRHQLQTLTRNRAVLRHATLPQPCDLQSCPADHWRRDRTWTLVESLEDLDEYAVLRYKPTGRYFPAIAYATAIRDSWFADEIDRETLLAILIGSTLTPVVCLLTWEQDGDGIGVREPRTRGYTRRKQAKEACWKTESEATWAYEIREAAEEDWHEQERDGMYAIWSEKYGVLYASHALWEWDARYYQRADDYRQQFLSRGLLDPQKQQLDERFRQSLCWCYKLPDTASWEQIREAIERENEEGGTAPETA